MNLFRSIFKPKRKTLVSYREFWSWFQSQENKFYNVVRETRDINGNFLKPLSEKLAAVRDGYFFLTGMCDEHRAELIFTADGCVKNFAFVEDLVSAAPAIDRWRFTAHKPALDIKHVNIDMEGDTFNAENIRFRPIDDPARPDEINLSIFHSSISESNHEKIGAGVFIFLDNYLGELNVATMIDAIKIESFERAPLDLIPIEKLKDYLLWREKEFIEKYEGTYRSTLKDTYTVFEQRHGDGDVLVASINTDLLTWDRKASHPWILKIESVFDDSCKESIPDNATYSLLDGVEELLDRTLKEEDGYLKIGRISGNGTRETFYACKEFRASSRVVTELIAQNTGRLRIDYDIYKDKYWKTFDQFSTV